MANTWNAAIDATFSLSDVTWFHRLWHASKQRCWATGANTLTLATAPPLVTEPIAPFDWQLSTWWSGIQSAIQASLGTTLWIKDTTVLPPTTSAGILTSDHWTFATIRAAAGLAGTDWRRKRPREIIDFTTGFDGGGNAVANGQVAWYVGATSGGFYKGDLIKRVAGAWVKTSTAVDSPDELDSDAGTLSRGVLQSGDYIKAYLFEELRAIINLLRQTWKSQGRAGYFWENTGNSGGGNLDTDTAGAIAAAEADFDAMGNLNITNAYGVLADQSIYAYTRFQVDTPGFVTVQIHRSAVRLGDEKIPNPCARIVRWFLKPHKDAGVSVVSFDAQGQPLTENAYTEPVAAAGPTSAANVLAADTLLYTKPPNYDAWAAGDPETGRGHNLNATSISPTQQAIEVIRWDVAGGFDETASSP